MYEVVFEISVRATGDIIMLSRNGDNSTSYEYTLNYSAARRISEQLRWAAKQAEKRLGVVSPEPDRRVAGDVDKKTA